MYVFRADHLVLEPSGVPFPREACFPLRAFLTSAFPVVLPVRFRQRGLCLLQSGMLVGLGVILAQLMLGLTGAFVPLGQPFFLLFLVFRAKRSFGLGLDEIWKLLSGRYSVACAKEDVPKVTS